MHIAAIPCSCYCNKSLQIAPARTAQKIKNYYILPILLVHKPKICKATNIPRLLIFFINSGTFLFVLFLGLGQRSSILLFNRLHNLFPGSLSFRNGTLVFFLSLVVGYYKVCFQFGFIVLPFGVQLL